MLKNPNSYERYIDVLDGKLWYKVIGLQQKTPIIVITGGASYSHNYLTSLSTLSSNYPIIFYDQLACGKFSVNNNPKKLWNLESFSIELETLINSLEFPKLHIFAHSWGAALAVEFALKKPNRVASLILASPVLSVDKWVEDAWNFRRTLPKDIQERMDSHELVGNFESVNYQTLVLDCYKKCMCRMDPWPRELIDTVQAMDEEISKTVFGINMFWITGNISGYDCTNRLEEITCPTLLTRGRYDIVSTETSRCYQSLIRNSRLEVFQHSAHVPHLEEPKSYLQVLEEFLSFLHKY